MNSDRKIRLSTRVLPFKSAKLQNPGRSAFIFWERIASRYSIFRKPGRLPSLVFLRLFRAVSGGTKTTNIHRTELIRNYFGLYFNLYFDADLRILSRPGTYHYNQFRISAANKMFRNNAAFLSFPGLTGESIKALQVLSRGTSDMTCKKIAYAFTDNRISRMRGKALFTEKVIMPAKAGIQTLSPRKRGTRRQEILDARLKISGMTEKEFRGDGRRNLQILFQQPVSNYGENRSEPGREKIYGTGTTFARNGVYILKKQPSRVRRVLKPASMDLLQVSETIQNTEDSIQLKKEILRGKHNILLEKITGKNISIRVVKRAVETLPRAYTSFAGNDIGEYSLITAHKPAIHLNPSSVQTRKLPVFNNSTEKLIHKPAVPASGKNPAGSADIISADRKEIYTVKKSSADTVNHFKKETVKETSLREIDTLADRVYRIIEKRIAIEKERIGRF